MTARHHSDGEDKEQQEEERQQQGGHVVPASSLLPLMRPQVRLAAHCAFPFRNGNREGRATPGTRGRSRAAPRYHGASPRAAAQSGILNPLPSRRGAGPRTPCALAGHRSSTGWREARGALIPASAMPETAAGQRSPTRPSRGAVFCRARTRSWYPQRATAAASGPAACLMTSLSRRVSHSLTAHGRWNTTLTVDGKPVQIVITSFRGGWLACARLPRARRWRAAGGQFRCGRGLGRRAVHSRGGLATVNTSLRLPTA